MRGVNHARSLGAFADNRRCRDIHQGRFCESLHAAERHRGLRPARGTQALLWGLALALALLCPSVAHALTAADMGVVWGPNPVAHQGSGRIDEGVICIADNAYDAALVTCGVMTNDERLTADAKAKLSNESSGGSFYTLTTMFKCFQGEDGYNYPDWVSNPYGLIEGFSYMYGNSSVWWARYESYLLTSAKEDLQTILAGGSLGGGSGSGSGSGSGGYYLYKGYCQYVTSGQKLYFGEKNNLVNSSGVPANEDNLLTNQLYIRLPVSAVDSWLSQLGSGYTVDNTVVQIQCVTANGTISVYLYAKNEPITSITLTDASIGSLNYKYYNCNTSIYFKYTAQSVTTYSIGKYNGDDAVTLSDFNFSGSTTDYVLSNRSRIATLLYDTGETIAPPTNWPESEPTTPKTKPVVPDPPDTTAPTVPTYDPKSYTNPVITTGTGDTYNSTTINTYNYNLETSVADGQDIIPYLQAILAATNNISRNLATYMINIQSLINDVIEANDNNASQIVAKLTSIITAINNACSTINSGIGELDTDINTGLGEIYDLIGDFQGAVHNEFRSLKTYLKSLFQWLADQFDYTFDGGDYDDSSILYWLRRIYYKLGAGRVNTRPTDPVADPVGIGDWLAQLFRNFLGGLLGIGGDALDAVLDALDDLRDKFPFSIPWDLAAILALLVADPVAPNFDVPQYSITNEGLQQVATYHIDLSVFDDVMVGVRTMETLVFAFCLAFKTDFFKGLLEVHGGE